MHPHPPEPHYYYKLVFYCKAISTEILPGFDIDEAAWFPLSDLPVLSTNRITGSQIQLLYTKVMQGGVSCYTD